VELANDTKQRTATLIFMVNCRAGTTAYKETEFTLVEPVHNRANRTNGRTLERATL
jgi:hypothetical protein